MAMLSDCFCLHASQCTYAVLGYPMQVQVVPAGENLGVEASRKELKDTQAMLVMAALQFVDGRGGLT